VVAGDQRVGHGFAALQGPASVVYGVGKFELIAGSRPDELIAKPTRLTLDSTAVLNVMRRHPRVQFKITVDACYSGRWLDLRARNPDPNQIRVIATSSSAGRPSPGSLHGRLNGRRVRLAAPFTHGLVDGIARWASDPDDVARDGGRLENAIATAFGRLKSVLTGTALERLQNGDPQLATAAQILVSFRVSTHGVDDGSGHGSVTFSHAGGGSTVTLGPRRVCDGQIDKSAYRTCQAFMVPLGAHVTLTATGNFLFWKADSACSNSKEPVCKVVADGRLHHDYAEAVFGEPVRPRAMDPFAASGMLAAS